MSIIAALLLALLVTLSPVAADATGVKITVSSSDRFRSGHGSDHLHRRPPVVVVPVPVYVMSPRPDRARRLPLAHRSLRNGPPFRRSGPALHADGHPGEGRERVPSAPRLQRSAARAIRALRGQRAPGRLRRIAALPARRDGPRARAASRDAAAGRHLAAAHARDRGAARRALGGAP